MMGNVTFGSGFDSQQYDFNSAPSYLNDVDNLLQDISQTTNNIGHIENSLDNLLLGICDNLKF